MYSKIAAKFGGGINEYRKMKEKDLKIYSMIIDAMNRKEIMNQIKMLNKMNEARLL